MLTFQTGDQKQVSLVLKGTKTIYILLTLHHYAQTIQYANLWALTRSLRGFPRNSAIKSAPTSAHCDIQNGRAGI